MMVLNAFALLGCLLFSLTSLARVQFVTVDPNTVSRIETHPSGRIKLFAGSSGSIGECSTPITNQVCNACTALDVLIGTYQCAERSIHGDLALKITMAFDTIPKDAEPLAFWTHSSGSTIALPVEPTTAPTTAGQNFEVQIKWSSICLAAGFNHDCSSHTDFSTTGFLYVGLTSQDSFPPSFEAGNYQRFDVRLRSVQPMDSSSLVTPTQQASTGLPFTDFRVLPGDSKVYIQDVWRGSTGPASAPSIKWQSLRVYFQEMSANSAGPNFSEIPLNQKNYQDFEVMDRNSVATTLRSNELTGLQNGQKYMFTMASVDESTIVTGILDPAELNGLNPEEVKKYIATPHPSFPLK